MCKDGGGEDDWDGGGGGWGLGVGGSDSLTDLGERLPILEGCTNVCFTHRLDVLKGGTGLWNCEVEDICTKFTDKFRLAFPTFHLVFPHFFLGSDTRTVIWGTLNARSLQSLPLPFPGFPPWTPLPSTPQKWSAWEIPLSCVTLTERSQIPAVFPPLESLPEKLVPIPHSSNPADVRALRCYCDFSGWLNSTVASATFTFHPVLICGHQMLIHQFRFTHHYKLLIQLLFPSFPHHPPHPAVWRLYKQSETKCGGQRKLGLSAVAQLECIQSGTAWMKELIMTAAPVTAQFSCE